MRGKQLAAVRLAMRQDVDVPFKSVGDPREAVCPRGVTIAGFLADQCLEAGGAIEQQPARASIGLALGVVPRRALIGLVLVNELVDVDLECAPRDRDIE